MIRILIVDDHPALRSGLQTVLGAEPGLAVAGSAATVEELFPALHRTRPDVVLLDYHLPPGDGLQLCRAIKQQLMAPRVLMYSAYADERLRVAALIAGADGLLNKNAPARELYETIRVVAAGKPALGAIGPEHLGAAMQRIAPDDAPIVGMLLDRTPQAEIARVLGVETIAIERRIGRMLERLRVDTPAASAR